MLVVSWTNLEPSEPRGTTTAQYDQFMSELLYAHSDDDGDALLFLMAFVKSTAFSN